jgi:hypothetical protein
MNAESELAAAEAELEKQRTLNERLENDLLQLEAHKAQRTSGDATPADGDDVLAGLDLGKKPAVCSLQSYESKNNCLDSCLSSLHPPGTVPYRLLQPLIPRSFLL